MLTKSSAGTFKALRLPSFRAYFVLSSENKLYLFQNQLVKMENMTSGSKMCVLTVILEMLPIAVLKTYDIGLV